MERNEQLFERIENYLTRKMPSGEATSFEKEIQTNPDLALELEMHRSERDAVELVIEENLRDKIKGWRGRSGLQNETPPPPKKGGNRGFSKLASIVFLIVLIGGAGAWYLWFKKSQPNGNASDSGGVIERKIEQKPSDEPKNEDVSNQREDKDDRINQPQASLDYSDVFLQAYQRPEADDIARNSAQTMPEDLLSKASLAYDAKKTKEVIALLAPVEGGAQYLLLQQILGHAYLQERDFARAESCFNRLIASGDESDGAAWHLLLSKVGQGKVNDADFDHLMKKMIEDKDHSYHPDAVRLQQKLH